MNQVLEQKWAVFQSGGGNPTGGQVGKSWPTQSQAILQFMTVYNVTKEQWDEGVRNKKYDVRGVMS